MLRGTEYKYFAYDAGYCDRAHRLHVGTLCPVKAPLSETSGRDFNPHDLEIWTSGSLGFHR